MTPQPPTSVNAAPAKPAAKKAAAKPVPGVEKGDHVYIQGKDGPMAVRVLSHGKDGLYGRCDQGKRHGVPWGAVLGHKARMLNEYQVVDQGADGAILEDPKGKRRFIAGEMPPVPAAPKPPTENDDPLLAGLGRLGKSLELPDMTRLPAGRILLLKASAGASAIANRPGLALKHVTDKGGHDTQRWAKTGPEEPAAQPGPAPHKHGDTVQFRHHDVQGEGQIVGSGGDGVTVKDQAGREHQVRHEHILKPGEQELPPAPDQAKPSPAAGANAGAGSADAGGAGAPEPTAPAAAPAAAAGALFAPDQVKGLPTKAAQPFKTQAELYAKSTEALGELKGWLDQGKGICSQLGYQTMGKGMDGVDWSKPGGMLFIAPLKGEKRAAEKVASDYGGDWSQLKDVVRCSIAVDNMSDIKDVVDALQKGGMKLAQQPKDRFNKPLPEGYRDLMLSVQFANGTIGEVQVHLKAMLEAKEAGHKPYETMRTIDGKPREQWSDEDKTNWQAAFDQSCKIYGDAWKKASSSAAPPDEGKPAAAGGDQGTMTKAMGAEPEWEFRDREGATFRRPKGQPGGITDVLIKGKWQPYAGDRTAAYMQSDLCEDPLGGGGGGDMNKSLVLFFKAAKPDTRRSLYVRRDVLNGADIAKHYRDQGCTPTADPSDMHCTVCYSKEPVEWGEMGVSPDKLDLGADTKRRTAPLGDKGAMVLHLHSDDLTARHQELRKRGVSHDFDGYQPHVTVSYDGKGFDKAKPYAGPIHLGPEIFEEPTDGWRPTLNKATIAGGAHADLFAVPVAVKAHTTKSGVQVKAHTAIRHKGQAPEDHAERHQAAQAAYREAYTSHAAAAAKPLLVMRDKPVPAGTDYRQEAPPPPPDSPAKEQNPEPAKKHFYVSAIDPDTRKKHLVAGPYGSHEEALGRVAEVRQHASKHQPLKADFMAWGTAGSDAPLKTPLGKDWKSED